MDGTPGSGNGETQSRQGLAGGRWDVTWEGGWVQGQAGRTRLPGAERGKQTVVAGKPVESEEVPSTEGAEGLKGEEGSRPASPLPPVNPEESQFWVPAQTESQNLGAETGREKGQPPRSW